MEHCSQIKLCFELLCISTFSSWGVPSSDRIMCRISVSTYTERIHHCTICISYVQLGAAYFIQTQIYRAGSLFAALRNPDLSNHGPHQSPEGGLWYLAPRCQRQILYDLSAAGLASVGQTCLLSSSQWCSIWLRFGEFRGRVRPQTINYLGGPLSCRSTVVFSIWERHWRNSIWW